MVEKEIDIIGQINDVIEDCDEIEILDFMGVNNLFEEENQIVELFDINYGVDNSVEDCGIAKVDAIVSMKKIK